jgi:nucleoid-associated protein YgaU
MPANVFRSARARVARSFAARAVRDPGILLVAGVGAGSAWAIGLPFGATIVVGAGMLGVATVVGDRVRHDPDAQPLRVGTPQAILVLTLQGYRDDLERLQHSRPAAAVAGTAVQAGAAARDAETVANRVAVAVDAVDDALTRADRVARQMTHTAEVRASIHRMQQRRSDLLAKLAAAVDEVGEVYTKLLELSTTADLIDVPTDDVSAAAQLNDSLDAIRGAFAELETEAITTRALL